jgi:penicillin-binding protein 2
MARAFGLGQRTGIDQVDEATGNITDPTDVLVAANEAVGQDPVLVTPLQVATFIAAVGNGGTLYRPQLIEKVQPVYGDPTVVFKPEARATLPLTPQNLKTLQDALISVVKNDRGTAYYRLRGLDIPVAGKTGTAESGIPGEPHAWFTGYTYASENTGLPDIAIAVVLENAGEGSDYAAPVFRRVVETYFYGRPQALYWWELEMGITRTPTPFGGIPTRTPKKRP